MDTIEIFTELSSPEGRADPYRLYAALHELGEVIAVGPDELIVIGYDANNAVLRDPGFRVSDQGYLDQVFPGWRENPVFVQGADWLLNLNGSRHARIRRLIARAFTARRVAGLEPAITKIADELIDAMADRGADGSAVEFMHDFAYLLPVTVICELIGIPQADREGFRPIARDVAGVFELHDPAALPAINAAATEPASVTSSPSRIQVMPNAAITRTWKRPHGRRSSRAGMRVETTDADVDFAVDIAMTRPMRRSSL